LTPGELRGIGSPEHTGQRDTDQHRLEEMTRGHVDLATAARLLRVFLERRLEYRRPEVHAGEPE